jgi:uncharacterized integral membrane protein
VSKHLSLFFYFALLITICILGILFAKDNSTLVKVSYWGNVVNVKIWVLVFLSVFLGFIISFLMMFYELVKLSFSKRKFEKSYKEVKKTLEDRLKNLNEKGE